MGLTRDYATTLYNWLSGFLPTYRSPITSTLFDEENPRPNEYIEYSADIGNFNKEFIQPITIYSQSTSYNNIMNIVDEIEDLIGENGLKISDNWGYIIIYKGTPFYQDKPDEDDNIRAGYVNFLVRICQKNV